MQIAKSQSAYEYIKEMILTGELSPRIDISEKQLQQELGISRTPVQDIYETRLLIEPFMTKNAVDLVPKDWMEDLRRRLLHIESLQSRTDLLAVMKMDTELHTTIASYCSNRFLRESLHLVYEHDRRVRLKTEKNHNQVGFSQKEHILILDAMLAGDREKTEQLAREHVIHSRNLTYESLGFTHTDGL